METAVLTVEALPHVDLRADSGPSIYSIQIGEELTSTVQVIELAIGSSNED